MESSVDPSICPTCGEPNTCGMSQGLTECWCFSVGIPRTALDRIPAEAKDRACICPRCAQAQAQALAEPK
jgi:hypothetical protein